MAAINCIFHFTPSFVLWILCTVGVGAHDKSEKKNKQNKALSSPPLSLFPLVGVT
jgi:hypothetical protein